MEISDALWQKLRRQRLAGTPSPPDLLNIHRRHVEFRAKVFVYRGCRVAIGDQQIDLPVRWRPWIAKRCRGTPPRHLSITKQFCQEKTLMRGLGSKEESLAFWGARGLSSTDRKD